MPGTLYIVSTPIGNLKDLTPRAAETFTLVDFIAAEDTRVTIKLLNHLGIKKTMISYYQHNAKHQGSSILARIQAGESCALCSDAGVPAISDPGEALVQEAHSLGIRVVPIPAASAAVTALCVSGQATGRFVFEGFLPMNKKQRAAHLNGLLAEERTIIFYEAPHKLPHTLQDLVNVFGEERSVSICRELTKLHEEIFITTLGAALQKYQNEAPRGEFVLVMAGAPSPLKTGPTLTLEETASLALTLARANAMSASDAAKQVASKSEYSKSEIYRATQKLKEEHEE